MKQVIISTVIATSLLLGACATRGDSSPNYTRQVSQRSVQYGYVEDVGYVEGRGASTGGGAIVGGIVGGVLGHQVGNGRGNTAATVVGAAGGAMIGNEDEKNQNVSDRIEVRVRLDNGTRVTYTQEGPRDFRNGDRVRIEAGRVFRG
jgi:outer membrane lipoprotein SlyB